MTAPPLDPGRDRARRLLERELTGQEYAAARPGPVERFVDWLSGLVGDLLSSAAGVGAAGWAGLLVVVSLLLVGAALVRRHVGPLARSGRATPPGSPLFAGRGRSAADHRRAADAHAARQEWDDALRERVRAVVRALEERGVLDERAGRTADEAAEEASRALPALADRLRAAAVAFDEVVYGGRRAGAHHDDEVRRLDADVQAAQPVLVSPARQGWA